MPDNNPVLNKPVLGKNKLLLVRVEGKSGNAWKPAFQTEHSFDESRDFESDPTKDGSVLSPGEYEGSLSFTVFQKVGDDQIKDLKTQVRNPNPDRLEVWEVDTTDMSKATVPGVYAKTYINSVNGSNPTDGKVEYSIDAQVDGYPIDGEINVTPALKALVETLAEEQEFVQPTENGGPEGA